MPVPSTRILVTGATGSGKSTLLRDWLLPAVPRALILDSLGECWEWPDVAAVPTVAQAADLLIAGHPRVVLSATADELARLPALLAPDTPTAPNLPRAVGGLALVHNEVDQIAPNGRTLPAWANLWHRGRHVGLSILAATRRAATVDRLVSSQSDVLVSCAQQEPRDLNYLADAMPPAVMAPIPSLPPLEAVVYFTREHPRRAVWLAPDPPYVPGVPPSGTYVEVATWSESGGWAEGAA